MEERSARELIDDAASTPFGDRRRQLLTKVLLMLAESPGRRDHEAYALALALLAQQDPAYLDEAEVLCREAEAANTRIDWAAAHLAEAWADVGDWSRALEQVDRVDRRFFDERDLHWRAVRMDEVRGAALLHLGRLDEAGAVVRAVCEEIRVHGDDQDLAPPHRLVQALLELVGTSDPELSRVGCTLLRELGTSLDTDEWFAPELAARIRMATAQCNGPGSIRPQAP